jgi:hypothetical protein
VDISPEDFTTNKFFDRFDIRTHFKMSSLSIEILLLPHIWKKSFKGSLCNEGGENIMTIHIRRVLIEALKARETSLVELSQVICATNGVEECDIVVTDVDAKTETIKLTVRGANIEYSGIVSILQENGVSVKGVDEVNVSKVKQISQRPTP